MGLKVIKSEADYDQALRELERLITLHPKLGSKESNQLEILSLLIENYENEHFHFDLPDPISAIKFVMEQRDLRQVDLVPYIGSRPKVSEILSGKRQLSLSMMRKLNEGLGIPAEVLLRKPKAEIPVETDIQWGKFPLAELSKRDWFPTFKGTVHRLKEYAEDLMRPKIDRLLEQCASPILPSGSLNRFRGKREINIHSLVAWQARVVEEAILRPLKADYSEDSIQQLLENIARLTVFDEGPLLARELLNKNGIHLIIERHFNGTFLDGGIMVLTNGTPVIGLTLRYDRLDNFWFSLMHELAHLANHFNGDKTPYFDDFDHRDNIESFEVEADRLASEFLIPKDKWSKRLSKRYGNSGSFEEISQHAKELNVHEAVLVGRIHYDSGNYDRYRRLLGKGILSKLFVVDISN